MKRWFTLALIGLAGIALAACEESKEDILAKAETVSTKAELRSALGEPDDISKTGPIEIWTYDAANGTVSFTLAGETVTITTTGDKKP